MCPENLKILSGPKENLVVHPLGYQCIQKAWNRKIYDFAVRSTDRLEVFYKKRVLKNFAKF